MIPYFITKIEATIILIIINTLTPITKDICISTIDSLEAFKIPLFTLGIMVGIIEEIRVQETNDCISLSLYPLD